MTCEDWMLRHAERGSQLHVRYPAWKSEWRSTEPPPAVEVDRAIDDGSAPPVVFDSVFLCRSGAWVPPWCDDQFDEFCLSFPADVVQLDEPVLHRRFDRDEVMAARGAFALWAPEQDGRPPPRAIARITQLSGVTGPA